MAAHSYQVTAVDVQVNQFTQHFYSITGNTSTDIHHTAGVWYIPNGIVIRLQAFVTKYAIQSLS